MALIKCPECGKEVSDKATSCVHCGYPINSSSQARSVAIVYGLRQGFLIGGTMKLYIDDKYVASVDKGAKVEIPITKNCVLTAKCGINPCKGRKNLQYGKTTKIQIVYERFTGSFLMQDLD